MDGKEEAKKKLGLGDDVPMLDMDNENFNEILNFELWSTHSSSDYRNDRERPYNGQAHTDYGERGKQLVVGLTMRDIKDCLVMAILDSIRSDKTIDEKEMERCWDFSTTPPTPKQYLLDRIDESDYISEKVELGTWRPQDLDRVDASKVNLEAIGQNLTCHIEKMMGIFPNIPKKADE